MLLIAKNTYNLNFKNMSINNYRKKMNRNCRRLGFIIEILGKTKKTPMK